VSNEIEIQKNAARGKVVPAAPPEQLRPKNAPLRVGNPTLVPGASPVPTMCAQCGAPVHRKPASIPFKAGPHRGGFLCQECWILEWAGNPEIAADAPTRQWFAEEAERIKIRRAGGAQVLYQDGVNRAYLTQRGTVLLDLAKLPFGGPDEYDPGRFQAMLRLFEAVAQKVPGFAPPAAPPPPSAEVKSA
jgi:hypothetical protein